MGIVSELGPETDPVPKACNLVEEWKRKAYKNVYRNTDYTDSMDGEGWAEQMKGASHIRRKGYEVDLGFLCTPQAKSS